MYTLFMLEIYRVAVELISSRQRNKPNVKWCTGTFKYLITFLVEKAFYRCFFCFFK